jgi:hypothetical protein
VPWRLRPQGGVDHGHSPISESRISSGNINYWSNRAGSLVHTVLMIDNGAARVVAEKIIEMG